MSYTPTLLDFAGSDADNLASAGSKINTNLQGIADVFSNLETLTFSSNITPDFSVADNFEVTVTGDFVLENPSNPTVGQSGVIIVVQDGSGGHTFSTGTNYYWPNQTTPPLTTLADAIDVIAYFVRSSTCIICTMLPNLG